VRRFTVPDPILAVFSCLAIILAAIINFKGIPLRFILSGASFLALLPFFYAERFHMGLGDIKFISLIAFCLDIKWLWVCLSAACTVGIIVYITIRLFNKKGKVEQRIPFIPFLGAGICISIILMIFYRW
jgi:prepilin signal peptidase PulO-like enzyme (type II secretory pathway)